MNGLSQDSLLTILKIAIVPVMLLSILWRNRREKRRRAMAETQATTERSRSRREVVDLTALDVAGLRGALERAVEGLVFVTPQGHPLHDAAIRTTLAVALMDAGRFEAVGPLLTVGDDRDPGLLLCRARLYVHQGQEPEARAMLSEAADLQLAEMKQAARGMRVHLAEMLAEAVPTGAAPGISDLRLTDFGPLACLYLAGRGDAAQALAAELVDALDRALASVAVMDDGRIDGLPRSTVEQVRQTLSGVALWGAA